MFTSVWERCIKCVVKSLKEIFINKDNSVAYFTCCKLFLERNFCDFSYILHCYKNVLICNPSPWWRRHSGWTGVWESAVLLPEANSGSEESSCHAAVPGAGLLPIRYRKSCLRAHFGHIFSRLQILYHLFLLPAQATAAFQTRYSDIFPTKVCLQLKIREVRQKIMQTATPTDGPGLGPSDSSCSLPGPSGSHSGEGPGRGGDLQDDEAEQGAQASPEKPRDPHESARWTQKTSPTDQSVTTSVTSIHPHLYPHPHFQLSFWFTTAADLKKMLFAVLGRF